MKVPFQTKAKIIAQNLLKAPSILASRTALGPLSAAMVAYKCFLPDDDDTRIIARIYTGTALIGGAVAGATLGAFTSVGLLAGIAGGVVLGIPTMGALLGLRDGLYEVRFNTEQDIDIWRAKNSVPLPPQKIVEASPLPKKGPVAPLRNPFTAKVEKSAPEAKKPAAPKNDKPSPPPAP